MHLNKDIAVSKVIGSEKNNIFIEKDDKPSRFMVNLNFLDTSQEEKNKKGFFRTKIDKYAISLKNYFFPKKESGIKQIEYTNVRNRSEIYIENLKSDYNNFNKRIERLAIYPLVKIVISILRLVFNFIYKISYRLGWIAVFILRFIIISGLKIIRSIIKFSLHYKLRHKKLNIKSETEDIADNPDIASADSPNTVAAIIKKENRDDEQRGTLSFKSLIPSLNLTTLKGALYFAVFLFLLVLPIKGFLYYKQLNNLKGYVLGVSEAAVMDMTSATKSATDLNFIDARESFDKASQNFSTAKTEINSISKFLGVLSSIIPNKEIKMAGEAGLILEAGDLSAQIGTHLSLPLASLSKDKINFKEVLDSFYLEGTQAAGKAQILITTLNKINPGKLPLEYRAEFKSLKEKSDLILISLTQLGEVLDDLRTLMGFENDKRYLLVFQNNAEIRASGGFIGSFAIIDFRDGEIKNIEVPQGGSYDTEGGLFDRIIAPEPLHLVNPLWHFWDANWWPDWPTSARKLMWFYEKSGGSTVDGVVSLTPTVVEDILRIIGSVNLEGEYNLEINASNFWEITQTFSEQKPEDHPGYFPNPYLDASSTSMNELTQTPKKIIGDLMEKIVEKISTLRDKDMFLNLIGIVEENFNSKQILVYFNDDELQASAIKNGWDGGIKETSRDYLMVVNSNIGGGKSDRKIREEIHHEARVEGSGEIVNTLRIKRTHTGSSEELFTGVRNMNYIRIYVPLGSELISAQGFIPPLARQFEKPEADWVDDPDILINEGQAETEINSGTKIYSEFGKTVFANWSQIEPGETVTIIIKYRLPFSLHIAVENNLETKLDNFLNPNIKDLSPYSLYAQKQPGSLGSVFSSSLKLPNNYKIIWKYGDNIETMAFSWDIKDVLKTDKYWAVMMESE